MTGATVRHNLIKQNCMVLLAKQLHGQPCQTFDSDMKLRIRQSDRTRFYYPDLQVVRESYPQTAVILDWPTLIIEVLSPSTRQYDLDEKMQAYLQVPSLQSYIILEQHQPSAIVMRRTADGFLRESIEETLANINLPFIGCSLAMADIYKGIEFTLTCVQEPEVECQTNV